MVSARALFMRSIAFSLVGAHTISYIDRKVGKEIRCTVDSYCFVGLNEKP